MTVEQYYKELSLSFKKENEEMRKNPEKLDNFYNRYEEKYGNKSKCNNKHECNIVNLR